MNPARWCPLLCGVALSCASARVPEPWQRQYGGRTDCRGTSGTECFLYFKLIGGDPHSVCPAESIYPAEMRRRDCYSTFGVADPGHIDPGELERVALAPGPNRIHAAQTLRVQASRGDRPSLEILRRAVLQEAEFPERAMTLSWLSEKGDGEALGVLARGVLDPTLVDRRDWLPYLARLPGPRVGEYVLQAALSPDPEISRQAVAFAMNRRELPQERLWRTALIAARRTGAEECREHLRERLQADPRRTLLTLARLAHDPDVGGTADALLVMALGGRGEPIETLPDSRLGDVAFWARVGRLPSHLPGIEDETAVVGRARAREAEALGRLELGGTLLAPADDPGQLYVGVTADRWWPEFPLIAEIRDATGLRRWLLASHVTGPRDYCEPLPGKCRFPSWMPEGNYLVFPASGPVFPSAGRYEITFESPFGTFRSGPVTFDAPAPRRRATQKR